ncbi:hypothetical protein [Aromatoleum buckelii]|uniref:Uncharacterized protein n=1 Tax=Aromatoleum buckelii TaxID=200254 RepID=A0ABX1N7L4_9RHOO|nr:hypothetical protein [Aromatoleum buckelii]MCK0513234.1 hypothetical protein [Aromatoleum buckelii]
MKPIANLIRVTFVGAFALLAGTAKLLAFFMTAARDDDVENHERGADAFGRNAIAPFDYGPLGGLDIAEGGYTGYTVHGREPISVGRNGERVGAFSGDPIVHF